MDTLAGLWAPIVASAVLVFVASSLIWNVLGAHKWHVKGLPDEPGAREALDKQRLAAESLGAWFAYLLFVSYVVAFVCGQTLSRGTPYMVVFRVAGAVALAAYSFGQIPTAIWWGRPWKSALKEFGDGVVYALLTAGCFGWLWPE